MDIEEIKVEWKHYNQKLALSQQLNEKLIQSMLRERSRSRVSKVRRDNILYMILMLVLLAFLVGIFAGNPFDFKYRLQYLPYGILVIGVLLAIVSLIKSLQSFSVNINKVSLDLFLKKTIDAYESNKKIQRWFAIIMFSASTLSVFSFLPKSLEHRGLWHALGHTALCIVVSTGLYFTAYKLGAFKDKWKKGFENDLQELNELKEIASELKDN